MLEYLTKPFRSGPADLQKLAETGAPPVPPPGTGAAAVEPPSQATSSDVLRNARRVLNQIKQDNKTTEPPLKNFTNKPNERGILKNNPFQKKNGNSRPSSNATGVPNKNDQQGSNSRRGVNNQQDDSKGRGNDQGQKNNEANNSKNSKLPPLLSGGINMSNGNTNNRKNNGANNRREPNTNVNLGGPVMAGALDGNTRLLGSAPNSRPISRTNARRNGANRAASRPPMRNKKVGKVTLHLKNFTLGDRDTMRDPKKAMNLLVAASLGQSKPEFSSSFQQLNDRGALKLTPEQTARVLLSLLRFQNPDAYRGLRNQFKNQNFTKITDGPVRVNIDFNSKHQALKDKTKNKNKTKIKNKTKTPTHTNNRQNTRRRSPQSRNRRPPNRYNSYSTNTTPPSASYRNSPLGNN